MHVMASDAKFERKKEVLRIETGDLPDLFPCDDF